LIIVDMFIWKPLVNNTTLPNQGRHATAREASPENMQSALAGYNCIKVL